MTITSFNPAIITSDAASVIALFEALGFERRHTKTGINDEDITSVRMRYTGEDGKVFHVDITHAPVPKDITSIRMNVRDFDEACKMLEEKGFKNAQGDKITHTGSSIVSDVEHIYYDLPDELRSDVSRYSFEDQEWDGYEYSILRKLADNIILNPI